MIRATLGHHALGSRRSRFARRMGFTLVEMMIAIGIGAVVIAASVTFLAMAGRSLSGISAQAAVNRDAGYTLEFIYSRLRLATSVVTNASGNILTVGFDDNYTVDSDGDAKPYNDRDHYERFEFQEGAAAADNRFVYTPNTTSADTVMLIPRYGSPPVVIQKLLGRNIFGITNTSTVIINFSVSDNYANDNFQACSIQSVLVPRNRTAQTNVITILP